MSTLPGSKTMRCFVLLVLVALVAAASFLVVYSVRGSRTPDRPDRPDDHRTDRADDLDPEFPLPPSDLPMGLYREAGVVSNGGPCAQIGVDVMSKGGNAVDAVIATILCDGIYCPELMGIGGGFLMSIYNATSKKVTSINAREMAPAAASATMYVNDTKKSLSGALAIAVPGEIKGIETIYDLYGSGRVTWESLFEPSIRTCEEGIMVNERLEKNLPLHEEMIKNNPIFREAFINEKTGHVKKAGELYKFPMLAKTLKIIAKEGANAFYNGSLTAKLIEDLRRADGIITEEDLANYKVEITKTEPVQLKNGYKIHVTPPPSSSLVLAYILRVLDGILPAPDAGLDAHRITEAFKFAYAERSHLGDHNFVDVSELYDKVRSDTYMDNVRGKISDTSTSSDPKFYGADFDMPENHGTANMAVIDPEGNVVVCTSSVNTHFGSGFVSPSTGIIFNNEMDDFSTPGSANAYGLPPSPANFIEPGKRPLSSMCPTVLTDVNDDFVLCVGAAGGSKITLASAYVAAQKLWFDKTLKEAIDEPRFYHQLVPMEVDYEYGTTREVVRKLKDIGHSVVRLKNNALSAASGIAKSPWGKFEAMPDFRRFGNHSGY